MLGFILHLVKIMPISDGLIQAIDPLTIGLIAGGAQALIGGIGSIGARSRLRSLEGQEPKYEIPKEVFQATQMAQEMAQTGMPEASRMMALQGAQQSALQAGRRAEMAGRGALLGNISNIQAGLDRTNLSIAAQDAATRLQNQRFAQQALMTQAQYRDKAFANQWQSWMNKFQQERANVGAKERTMYGGFDMMTSMAAIGALGGGGGKTPKDVSLGADLTPSTSGVSSQRNALSGMSAIMGSGIRPPVSGTGVAMPGSQLQSPGNAPQPSYGLTSDEMISRSIFQSLIAPPSQRSSGMSNMATAAPIPRPATVAPSVPMANFGTGTTRSQSIFNSLIASPNAGIRFPLLRF